MLDNIAFGKIREKLGGHVRYMGSASAPLQPKVIEFLRICFSVPVSDGYGQTEAAGAVTASLPSETYGSNSGPPTVSAEIKLMDVHDLDYLTTDKPNPRGEICFRGPTCFTGYYKSVDKTKQTIDPDGWVHSGDIAVLNNTGTFSIIDRKKNIFKLSQGEYVAPEKIENVYSSSVYVQQICVYGNSYKSSIIAIIVVDAAALKALGGEKGIKFDSDNLEILTENEQIKEQILKDLLAKGKGALKGFEQIKKIHLTLTPFTVANDMLTPTLKIRRNIVIKNYESQIRNLYSDLD